MDMVNLTIDQQDVAVEAGSTIVDAARTINIRIPTLCYLDLGKLKMVNKVASCRICVVEVAGRENLAPACTTPVFGGMQAGDSQHPVHALAPQAGRHIVNPQVKANVLQRRQVLVE